MSITLSSYNPYNPIESNEIIDGTFNKYTVSCIKCKSFTYDEDFSHPLTSTQKGNFLEIGRFRCSIVLIINLIFLIICSTAVSPYLVIFLFTPSVGIYIIKYFNRTYMSIFILSKLVSILTSIIILIINVNNKVDSLFIIFNICYLINECITTFYINIFRIMLPKSIIKNNTDEISTIV
jgi:hypothetical protein